jgi:hypothetical protein
MENIYFIRHADYGMHLAFMVVGTFTYLHQHPVGGKLDKIDLSDSGKESKDHSSDNVIFDSRSSSNDDSEDEDSEN